MSNATYQKASATPAGQEDLRFGQEDLRFGMWAVCERSFRARGLDETSSRKRRTTHEVTAKILASRCILFPSTIYWLSRDPFEGQTSQVLLRQYRTLAELHRTGEQASPCPIGAERRLDCKDDLEPASVDRHHWRGKTVSGGPCNYRHSLHLQHLCRLMRSEKHAG